ncbi:hypothetical protein PFICI_14240 [Pestalotiopsis fici W106-1]|uniref:Uncharacterized protein n=1 Tax=Pestalotiopsis fici (strain W106-1 / CGMCC3.15140) TaxID=1229662 RepID=W3WKW0_PESFW|nr:uncharacterized protein PFICI_14240 [Pestalotiopsis fici W106-1]ETS74374.1 hypothetical protein PFICI_14240 [Pestalotiopsis fici W106-1]
MDQNLTLSQQRKAGMNKLHKLSEEEVIRLRGVELSLKDELEKARAQLRESKSKTPVSDSPRTTPSPPTTSPEPIVVQWDELYRISPEPACCIKAAENAPPELARTNTNDRVIQDTQPPPPPSWADAFSPGSAVASESLSAMKDVEVNETLLSLEMGVQCILRLETPCLPHLRNAMVMEPQREGYLEAPYNFGTNHAYNLSTRLINEYTSPSSPGGARIAAHDLDNLLQASTRLQLVDELTPVQVWALVCKLDSICRIDPVLVTAMFDELSNYSYCNSSRNFGSFGAAITKATIKAGFQHFLGWSDDI